MLINNVLALSTDSLEYDKAGGIFYVDASALYREAYYDQTAIRGSQPMLPLQQLNKDTKLVLTNPRSMRSMEFSVEAIDEYEGEVHGIRFVNENKTLKVVIFND